MYTTNTSKGKSHYYINWNKVLPSRLQEAERYWNVLGLTLQGLGKRILQVI